MTTFHSLNVTLHDQTAEKVPPYYYSKIMNLFMHMYMKADLMGIEAIFRLAEWMSESNMTDEEALEAFSIRLMNHPQRDYYLSFIKT